MSLTQLVRLLGEKKGSLILMGVFVAAVSLFVVTLISPRFKVTTDFLVAQTNTTSQDFYTLFKSSEYLGKVLAESMQSERFINAVIETGKISKEFLPLDKRERLNAWRKMVTIESSAELGRLTVVVKADTEREADRVMQGISEVLINRNIEFRGGDEKAIEIRILSGPITDRNPSPKELIIIVLTAFVAGVSLVATRILVRAALRGY